MITERTPAIIAENIPEELRERPQWLCWRLEERDSKPTKVPYQPSGRRASVTDLMTWSGFEHCVMEAAHHFDGVGFVFSSADPFAGIDLDKCRTPETGAVAPWAQEIISRVGDGYIEASPSGTGIHIIIRAGVRSAYHRRGPVEMYSRGRYFTFTGHVL